MCLRVLTVSLSVALVSSLTGSPLYHVHPAGDTQPGTVLHSHLPEASSSGHESHGSTFEAPSHDGRTLDLFLSLAHEDGPVAIGVATISTAKPRIDGSAGCGSYCVDRTHDPPLGSLSPRAPPR